jgi:hypothetical protein
LAENTRIEELRRRLEREPGSRLFAQLAEELRKEGEHGEAIRVARNGLVTQPNYPSARMTLGRALFDSGDYTAARAEFETVLRGAPDNILASRFLAECLEGMGDLGSALLQFRAAQRLAPADKNLETHIRTLEQTLSAPTMVRPKEEGDSAVAASVSPPVAVPPLAPAPPAVSVVPPLPPPPPPGTYAPVSPAFAVPPPPVPPLHAPPLPPPVVAAAAIAPPPPPAPARTPAATAEFDRQGATRTAVAEPPARPPLPHPPPPPPLEFIPEPPSPPTLIDESFDLEAPFGEHKPLRPEEAHLLPGRSLSDEPDDEAPTLPVTPAPTFDFTAPTFDFTAEPTSSLVGEPTLAPGAPPPAPAEGPRVPPPPPPPPSEPPHVAAPPVPLPPPPVPPPAPPPAPVAEAFDSSWRAPAPPRGRPLEETHEVGSQQAEPLPLPARDFDTTRVPAVTFPIAPPAPPPDPRPPLDAIRLEWAAAPEEAPPPPLAPAPAPAPIAIPVAEVAPSPAPPAPNPAPSEPLLSPTLAELYFNQGAMEMARSAYEQLLQREPANERYRARLGEIGRAVTVRAAADEDRAARRRVIEGQIARLEQLLAAVRRV